LDADYTLGSELIKEIENLEHCNNESISGYFIPFKYCVFGQPLRGTILPAREALFKKESAIYIDDGHTQVLKNKGRSSILYSFIFHDDRKPLDRWLWAQDRYMKLETAKILSTPSPQLSLSDKIRKTKILAPFLVFFYCLILKQGIFDGWPGWYYALQRTLAEILLAIHLIEAEKFNDHRL